MIEKLQITEISIAISNYKLICIRGDSLLVYGCHVSNEKAVDTSETSRNNHQTTQHDIPQHPNPQ